MEAQRTPQRVTTVAIEPALSLTKQLLDLVVPNPVMLLIIENPRSVAGR
jgi:hypothetical protein